MGATADGSKYDGEWRDGLPHGHGSFSRPNGFKYVGNWVQGKPHGTGEAIFPDGRKYVGEFRDGTQNGRGVSNNSFMILRLHSYSAVADIVAIIPSVFTLH